MILTIDWNFLSFPLVPEAVRVAVEGRLAMLWRFLGAAHLRDAARGNAASRSEGYRIDVGDWTFTYEVDVAEGSAIVKRAQRSTGLPD
jgi:hypothetical protein